ncbi:hypothetical protein Cob_v009685 [Colletotrichum orbiculare MAFF 240422]|uniref:MARVEL domain-containing protein n=1 Tax=Colletotrichum orbiculare (strain 104-T / ATCC 96160 / CBS 514.97 / LARS 414 / MAFF 240422) TaxID=1213857 RepID=A0A484FHM2_COLOR|nr:hypothetical protein Cob_v009685 [Colletotrichum orbiculare MAFF 240422]
MTRDYWSLSGPFGIFVRASLRVLQFVLSIVTIGLYAATLASWPSSALYSRTNFIFALIPAVLSILTCVYHVLATVTHAVWAIWDFALAVLWAALCGVSSALLIGGEDEHEISGSARTRLAAGAWIAGIAMVLYFLNAVHGCAFCCAARKFTRTVDKGNKIALEELPESRSQTAEQRV